MYHIDIVEVSSVENILKMLHKCCTQGGRVSGEIENCTFVAHAREGGEGVSKSRKLHILLHPHGRGGGGGGSGKMTMVGGAGGGGYEMLGRVTGGGWGGWGSGGVWWGRRGGGGGGGVSGKLTMLVVI